MKRTLIVLLLISSVIRVQTAYSFSAAEIYGKARGAAKSGSMDFAYMHFQSILRDFPETKFRKQALFAVGEYYVSGVMDEIKAAAHFKAFINEFPDGNGRIFALAHLYIFAKKEGNEEEAERLSKEIITSRKVSLIFRDFEEYVYRSPLNRLYRAVFKINSIEFYAEDQLFAEITY